MVWDLVGPGDRGDREADLDGFLVARVQVRRGDLAVQELEPHVGCGGLAHVHQRDLPRAVRPGHAAQNRRPCSDAGRERAVNGPPEVRHAASRFELEDDGAISARVVRARHERDRHIRPRPGRECERNCLHGQARGLLEAQGTFAALPSHIRGADGERLRLPRRDGHLGRGQLHRGLHDREQGMELHRILEGDAPVAELERDICEPARVAVHGHDLSDGASGLDRDFEAAIQALPRLGVLGRVALSKTPANAAVFGDVPPRNDVARGKDAGIADAEHRAGLDLEGIAGRRRHGREQFRPLLSQQVEEGRTFGHWRLPLLRGGLEGRADVTAETAGVDDHAAPRAPTRCAQRLRPPRGFVNDESYVWALAGPGQQQLIVAGGEGCAAVRHEDEPPSSQLLFAQEALRDHVVFQVQALQQLDEAVNVIEVLAAFIE